MRKAARELLLHSRHLAVTSQMMTSKAKTPDEYLASLPADRREALSAVRQTILKNLDKGYQEGMSYGMIGYCVPHSIYPAGYHCDPKQPLPFAGLASQKNHMAVYLFCMYVDGASDKWFRDAWKKAGKKLDMGKSCLRFKKLDDLALDVLGEAIRRVPVKDHIAIYESALKRPSSARPAKKTPAKPKAGTKKLKVK